MNENEKIVSLEAYKKARYSSAQTDYRSIDHSKRTLTRIAFEKGIDVERFHVVSSIEEVREEIRRIAGGVSGLLGYSPELVEEWCTLLKKVTETDWWQAMPEEHKRIWLTAEVEQYRNRAENNLAIARDLWRERREK